ncbi:MAG: polyphosphate polymerase domain-containing protein [Chthoniobacteraceae bacterium]
MKFEVSAAQRGVLMEQLVPCLRADEYAGAGARYPVVSLYYDNADRDCYWEKARSLPSRRKLRVRVYGSRDGAVPSVSFVEIKHKCDGRGVKRRVMLPLAQALRVCDGAEPVGVTLSESDCRIVAEVHDLVKRRAFRPVMVMRYDRTAFAGAEPGSDLRVTFDEGIHARLDHLVPDPDDRRFDMSREMHGAGAAVMEVKVTDCIPYWLSRVISATGCQMQSHSKYCSKLESDDPVLHAMLSPKWRTRCSSRGMEKGAVHSLMPATLLLPAVG